jgi:hypothetical protein
MKNLTLVGTFVVATAALSAQSKPAIILVPGERAWTDTRIDVRRGDLIRFEATDKIQFAKERPFDWTDANGQAGVAITRGLLPLPPVEVGALIGRVGRSYFFIGKNTKPIRMPAAGRLILGINDDHLADNGGAFRVAIAVEPAKKTK